MFMKTKENEQICQCAARLANIVIPAQPGTNRPPPGGVTVWWKIGAIGIGESKRYIKLLPTMFMKTEMVRDLSGNLHEKVSH